MGASPQRAAGAGLYGIRHSHKSRTVSGAGAETGQLTRTGTIQDTTQPSGDQLGSLSAKRRFSEIQKVLRGGSGLGSVVIRFGTFVIYKAGLLSTKSSPVKAPWWGDWDFLLASVFCSLEEKLQ